MEFVRNVDWITESQTVDIRPEMGHRIGGTKTNEREKVQIPKEKTGKKTELQKAKSSTIVQAEKKTSGKKGDKDICRYRSFFSF